MKVTGYTKTIVAGTLAAANAISIGVGDDVLTTTELISAVLSVLTALGVYALPNSKDKPAE